MFDLITGQSRRTPHHATLPILVAAAAQTALWATVITLPLLFVTEQLPALPSMMAFVAKPPTPLPPPPPPPPPAARKETPPAQQAPATTPAESAAPVVEPEHIEAEPAIDELAESGEEGGVEGGVPGGVVGGIVGGLPTDVPPPPPPAPPAPPAPPKGPVRIGGQIAAPALVYRVEPDYPWFAVNARIQGVVILEAVIDEQGRVASARVLRSPSLVLDESAIKAVRAWRYSPLQLNGRPTAFVLTVTLSFKVEES